MTRLEESEATVPAPTRRRLQINYLLEDTVLFGGVKVVLRQAELLSASGHRPRIVTPASKPSWFSLDCDLVQIASLTPALIPPADLQIATYWTTIAPAVGSVGQAVHYCQGYEASYTHNEAEHPAIIEAYREPLPGLVVSPHLGRLLATRYQRPSRWLPQPLEKFFAPRDRSLRLKRPRVLVMSPWEIDWKGVRTALRAVRSLTSRGLDPQLVRISQWPLTHEEAACLQAAEFHTHLAPREVAALMRECDLLLAPSWPQEGFGLPVLEAMASGVPVVCSDIDAFREFAGDAALRVPYQDWQALADAAAGLLTNRAAWTERRRRGLEIAAGFHEKRVTADTEEALYWIHSGAWRSEAAQLQRPPRAQA